MNVASFMERVGQKRFYDRQIVHVEHLPERPPVYAEVQGGLHAAVSSVLSERGVQSLYAHQSKAIELVRKGEHIVIVTGTASGKTFCYTIPVLESLIADSNASMLFIYPTKALAQDQLRGA